MLIYISGMEAVEVIKNGRYSFTSNASFISFISDSISGVAIMWWNICMFIWLP